MKLHTRTSPQEALAVTRQTPLPAKANPHLPYHTTTKTSTPSIARSRHNCFFIGISADDIAPLSTLYRKFTPKFVDFLDDPGIKKLL